LFPQPNAYGMRERGWSEWIVVQPGQSAIVNTGRVPVDLAVADIYSECGTSEPRPFKDVAIQDVTAAPDPASSSSAMARDGPSYPTPPAIRRIAARPGTLTTVCPRDFSCAMKPWCRWCATAKSACPRATS